MRLLTTKRFEKDLKPGRKRGKDLDKLWSVVERLLSNQPLDPRHRKHRLTGDWSPCWECHIAAVFEGQVMAPRSLLLRSALAEARVVSDTAGNEKLAKGSQSGRRALARDDAAAALILAVAEGVRRGVPEERRGLRFVAV